ncbi:hypothetical protein TcWFU_010188 [Taenia crassiceps]|uniref:BZIP domain-containing protein n=1 Tax=Taenia crassiceps TaxID=6207 RepID=A0ABR4Q7T6_9CEST
MLQPGCQSTLTRFPVTSGNFYLPSDSLEGSPSIISPDDGLEDDGFSDQSCFASHFPLPEELIDFVNSYAFSGNKQVSIEEMSKKRRLNRDAAYRYRQKVKIKNEKLQGELNAAIQAFKEAREMYECSRAKI